MSEESPVCACGNEAIRRTVVKDGDNRGRKFWKCETGDCKFFQWADQRPSFQEKAKFGYGKAPQQGLRKPTKQLLQNTASIAEAAGEFHESAKRSREEQTQADLVSVLAGSCADAIRLSEKLAQHDTFLHKLTNKLETLVKCVCGGINSDEETKKRSEEEEEEEEEITPGPPPSKVQKTK